MGTYVPHSHIPRSRNENVSVSPFPFPFHVPVPSLLRASAECAPKPIPSIKCDDRTWYYTLQGRSHEEVASFHRTCLQEPKKSYALLATLLLSPAVGLQRDVREIFFYWCGVQTWSWVLVLNIARNITAHVKSCVAPI